jgi:hypothetical protein
MADPKPTAPPAGSVTLYDKSGGPVVVDAAAAPGHIASGEYGYAPGTRVPVKIRGEIGTVDADELGDAVSRYGAKPVTSAQFHEHEQQKKYGSTAQAAAAFGVNTLDSATLGASNALIGGVGGQGAREYVRGITEANPSAATAGDVAGFVAPVAADVLSAGSLTPGIAAAEAARLAERGIVRGAAETALLGPTRLLSKAGEIAESGARALVGSEAKSAAARVAQSIIAGGARGAVEGGIANVGGEVGKQFLQDDPDLSGETLGSAFIHGALIGGALGGTLHGVTGLLTKKAAPALAGGVEKAEIGADEGIVKAADHGKAPAESTVADQAAKTIISQVDDPEKAKLLADAWKHKSFEGHGKIIEEASRKVTGTLDEAIESGRIVDMNSFGEAKSNHMAKLVPAENIQPARKMVGDVWADASKVMDGLETLPLLSGEKAGIKRLRMWLDDFGDLSDKAKWNDPAELFDKVDDFKRRIGKEAGFGRNVQGREESTRQFNELYDRVRLGLEDPSTWGAAAVAQREVNLATSSMIDTNSKFLQKFTIQYGSEAKTGAPLYIAESGKVNGFINGLTSAANDTTAKMATDYVAKRSQFLDAVTKNYDLPADALKAVTKERASLKSMSDTIAKTSDEVSRANQLKALMADERGHSLHGIIGLAIDSVTKPGISLARLAEMEAMKNRVVAKIDDGVASIKRALLGTGERGNTGLPPHSRDTYEKRRESVLHVASQADSVQAHLSGTVAPIATHAPAAAQAFQTASVRTLQYLMSALPKPPAPRADSLTPQIDMEAWTPSDQQKDQFSRKFDMATHPEHALKLVANGTITQQHVEALQATNPRMYAIQSQRLNAELSKLSKPVPYSAQGSIKTFLGIPQMDPDLQRLISQPASQAAKGGAHGAPKRPLKMTDNMTLNASKID